jgi:hypothetical protein
VERVLYRELKNLSPGDNDYPGWLFSLGNTREIIRRCEEYGGKVLYISHVSESGDRDEFLQVSESTTPGEALENLRAMGCNEKFSLTVKIPAGVVEQWKGESPG